MDPRRTLNGTEIAALMRRAAQLLDAEVSTTNASRLCADELIVAAIVFEDADADEKHQQYITPPTIKNELESRVRNAQKGNGTYYIVTDSIADS